MPAVTLSHNYGLHSGWEPVRDQPAVPGFEGGRATFFNTQKYKF